MRGYMTKIFMVFEKLTEKWNTWVGVVILIQYCMKIPMIIITYNNINILYNGKMISRGIRFDEI